MSHFYFSLVNDPKGVPLDEFFSFSRLMNPYYFAFFLIVLNSSPLTTIIEALEIVVFVYRHILAPFMYFISQFNIQEQLPRQSPKCIYDSEDTGFVNFCSTYAALHKFCACLNERQSLKSILCFSFLECKIEEILKLIHPPCKKLPA